MFLVVCNHDCGKGGVACGQCKHLHGVGIYRSFELVLNFKLMCFSGIKRRARRKTWKWSWSHERKQLNLLVQLMCMLARSFTLSRRKCPACSRVIQLIGTQYTRLKLLSFFFNSSLSIKSFVRLEEPTLPFHEGRGFCAVTSIIKVPQASQSWAIYSHFCWELLRFYSAKIPVNNGRVL